MLRFFRLWMIPSLVLFAGCGPTDDVRTYTVPRTTEASKLVVEKVRFLGAIIPKNEQSSWFVRFDGPIEVVDPLAKEFDLFVESIRIVDGAPRWKVPEGWSVGPPQQFRLVTLKRGSAMIYLSDAFEGTLLSNVNRWRGFTGLPDVRESDIPKVTTQIQLGTLPAWKVDYKGPGSNKPAGPMMGK